MKEGFDTTNCDTLNGKLALPYTYFAGRMGSTFLTTIRDEKKIMGVKCGKCDKVFVPPRQTCDVCLEDLRESWVDLKNTGEITNFTVVRKQDKHLPKTVPYILALIKLEGADSSLVHVVEGVDVDKVAIGQKVEAVFAEETTSTIMDIDHFKAV